MVEEARQIHSARVGSIEQTMSDRNSTHSHGVMVPDEEPFPQILAQWTGEWIAGTSTALYPEQDTVSMVASLASATNATWDQAARTMTKAGSFTSYTFTAGDVWIPTTTDGGWVIGAAWPVEARVSNDVIRLVAGAHPAGNAISDGVVAPASALTVLNTSSDIMTLANHRFIDGEPIQFTGTSRPSVGVAQISNAVQFYVKQVTNNTFQVYASRALVTPVDFSGYGGNYSIKRFNYFYAEDKNAGGNGREIYNTVGAPQNDPNPNTSLEDGEYRWPADDKYWDLGFDVWPNSMAMGSSLEGELTGMLRNCTSSLTSSGNRTLYLVLDPDPDVRANGVAGCVRFTASVVAATDVFTAVGHGLKSKDRVHLEQDGATTPPGGASLYETYYVRRLDADTFMLYLESSLTTVLNITVDCASVTIDTVPSGSFNAVRFACVVPNTISNVKSTTVTDGTFDGDGVSIFKIQKTAAFLHYVFQTGDQYIPTSIDGGFAINERFTVLGKTSDDEITIANDSGVTDLTALADQIGVVDGTVQSVWFTPFKWRWRFAKDLGQLAAANAVENGIWECELTVGPDQNTTDPATSSDGLRVRQTIRRTRPQEGNEFISNRKHDWGVLSRLRYYPSGTQPSFTYAAGGTITGRTSAATGKVVEHDRRAQTITYRRLSPDVDFRAGEIIDDAGGLGGNALTIGPTERGPLPTRISTRIGVSGTQDGRCELRAHHYRVVLNQTRPS